MNGLLISILVLDICLLVCGGYLFKATNMCNTLYEM